MKKKFLWIILAVAVVAVIGVVLGVSGWFRSPGVHVLGNDIHVELQRTGYIIDGETGEITGQTQVYMNGTSDNVGSNEFEGSLLVLDYQNESSGTVTSEAAVDKTDSGFYLIDLVQTCVHEEEVDGVTQDVEHFCDYVYQYCLYPENPDFLLVVVEDFEESTPIYVVCADSEAQALKDYQWYLENKP